VEGVNGVGEGSEEDELVNKEYWQRQDGGIGWEAICFDVPPRRSGGLVVWWSGGGGAMPDPCESLASRPPTCCAGSLGVCLLGPSPKERKGSATCDLEVHPE
jgi:hypothetical protein